MAFLLIANATLFLGPSFAQYPLDHRPSQAPSWVEVVRRTTTPPEPKLRLRVYNYARIDSATLARSEKVATAIFENANIKTAWVDCPTSKAQIREYPACQSDMGAADLVLRILPRHMAAKLRNTEDSLGFAQTCPEKEPACELSVFYHRVDELAAKGYREDRVLGYVIAHEVTHVLLGPGHSEEGIMRGAWTPHELQRISLGLPLNFTGDQSSQLRQSVLRRATPPIPEGFTQANLLAP